MGNLDVFLLMSQGSFQNNPIASQQVGLAKWCRSPSEKNREPQGNSKCKDRMGRDKIPQTKTFLEHDGHPLQRSYESGNCRTMTYQDIVISNSGLVLNWYWNMLEKSRLHVPQLCQRFAQKFWALSFLDPILKFLGDDLGKALSGMLKAFFPYMGVS